MHLQGVFLQSTSAASEDPVFGGARVFIHQHDAGGAAGHIVNQPLGRTLNELAEFADAPALPLYHGGPVDGEHLFFLHRRPDLIGGGTDVGAGVFWGGDFAAAVAALRAGTLPVTDIRVFVGYCGWDAGELEAEIEDGGWEVLDPSPALPTWGG
ncbi:YqgE/AlgH family protein [Flaviaesturariibacter flavus]|uniref:YqgE/AlgH family protein n=1 Tax=Flaviaesturariibacter flavus TaxID=2502780 RepID=A0A4R1BFE9_9BACT|nr:YqgE/AlgH family protein [Flaviaesturariibacter flavus]TCJ15834.1 YqgE/AlgH family protein [Flaviaesturariibacter flavus]